MRTTDGKAGDGIGGAADAVTERIVVWPHRSLGARGTTILIATVGCFLLGAGLWVMAKGAWPMLLHAGLAFGGFSLALWCNNSAARMAQVIEFRPDVIRVSEIGPAAKRQSIAEFDPCWVRVLDVRDRRTGNRLVLRQSGRTLGIGDFLSAEERGELGAELRRRIAARYPYAA